MADIGGGPGAYALWLAQAGYSVVHRDLVPGHVEELRQAASGLGLTMDADVGDARELDLVDDSADAVLLLGPLYHLTERADRIRALEEVRRILRPSGVAFIAAISRWAARLHGVVVQRLYQEFPSIGEELERVEATGELPPLFPGSFAGFCHRPDELRREIADAGLDLVDLISLEGIAFALSDLEDRLASAEDREVVLEAARRLGRVAELIGLGPHLLAIARRVAPGVG